MTASGVDMTGVVAVRGGRNVLAAVREWTPVAASAAALLAVLLQLYLTDAVDSFVPEWMPSVAVMVGLLAALAVTRGRRLLPRRFVLGFGWAAVALLLLTAGCLTHDILRAFHVIPGTVDWTALVAHFLALLAAISLAGRVVSYQRATRR